MSSTIDHTVGQTVLTYYQGHTDLDTVMSQIYQAPNSAHIITQLLHDIVTKYGNQELPDRVEDFYNNLTAAHESNLAAVPVHNVAMRHFARPLIELVTTPLTTSCLLSHLLATSSGALTKDNFTDLQASKRRNEPLEVSIYSYRESLAASLTAAQAVLGPIHSLKITCRTYSEDELVELINCCPELTSLCLTAVDHFTDEVVEEANWPDSLEFLDVQETDITSFGLRLLCTSCTKLCTLNVRGCKELSYVELLDIEYPKTLIDFTCNSYWLANKEFQTLEGAISLIENPSCVALTLAAVALSDDKAVNKPRVQKWLELALNQTDHKYLPAVIAYAELLRVGSPDTPASPDVSNELLDPLLEQFPSHCGLLAAKARLLVGKPSTFQQAREFAQLAYRQDPYNDFALATYAEILLREENFGLSDTLCDRAIRLNPRNSYALVCLADLATPTRHGDAIALLQEALEINFYNQEALFSLAMLHVKSNNFAEAKTHLEQLLKINPECGIAKFELTNICEQMNNSAAEPVLKKTKAQDHEDVPVAVALAPMLQVEMPQLTLDDCEKAYKHRPNDPVLLTLLGQMLLATDPLLGVNFLYEVIESHSQESLGAHVALAKHEGATDEEEAVKLLEQALKLSPNDIAANIERAKIAISHNQLRTAANHIQAALKADRNCPQALILFAKLQACMDKLDQATGTIETLVQTQNLDVQTRQDIFVLLLQYPKLLGDKRKEAVIKLLNG